MEPIIQLRNTQRWNDYVISPGLVGSVGDALPGSFLKTSCIDLARRVDKTFSGKKSIAFGSVVQNGSVPDTLTQGLGPRTIDSNWDIPRPVVPISNGWKYTNTNPPDLLTEPFVSSLGDYSWRNKIARVQGRTTGFETVPGEYTSTGVPRGGMIPRIVDWDMGTQEDALMSRQPFYGFERSK